VVAESPDEDALRLERDLRRLRRCPWLPRPYLNVLGDVLALHAAMRPSPPALADLPLASPEAHAMGAPLLLACDFPVDMGMARDAWKRIGSIIAEEGGRNDAGPIAGLAASMPRLRLHSPTVADDAMNALLRDDETFFANAAEITPEAPSLARFLAGAALAPQLAAVSRTLAPRHDPDVPWGHGHCPHCGSPPLVGRHLEAEGATWHCCSFCGLEYRAAGDACPFCLERSPRRLKTLGSPDIAGTQVHGCARCKAYLKVTLPHMTPHPLPPLLDDLATLPLDMLAQREGFGRVTRSAWGL
jgi:FdhE protein